MFNILVSAANAEHQHKNGLAVGLIVCICCAAAAPASANGREPTSYCAYELGSDLTAEAINNRNQIVGTAALDEQSAQAFVWDWDQGVRLLGVLPGAAISTGNDINDRGEVVGNSGGGAITQHSFIWDERNGMRDFATLGGQSSSATHINNAGQIIGVSTTAAEDAEHLYFRNVNGEVIDLGVGIPFGVNDFGQVGFSRQLEPPPLRSEVFIWHLYTGAQRLRGFPENRLILPSAMNNRAHIVGSIYDVDQQGITAIRWTRGKGMEDLGALSGSGFSNATDVNDWGTVVGYIEMGFPLRPFIWRKQSGMRDLTTMLDPTSPSPLEAELIAARAVNDLGWIVINTSTRIGEGPRAYVLRPKFSNDHSPCPSPPPEAGQ